MEASISVCLRSPAHNTKYTSRRRKARLMLSGVVVFGEGPPLRARVAEPSLHGFTLHLERVEQQEREDRVPVAVIAPAAAVDAVYSWALQRAQKLLPTSTRTAASGLRGFKSRDSTRKVKSTPRSSFKRRWSCLSSALLTSRLHLEALCAAKVQRKQPRLSPSFVPCVALHDTINAHWVPLGAALMANAAPLCWLPQWFHSSWQQVTRSRPWRRKRCRSPQCQFENAAPRIALRHAFIPRGKQFLGLWFPSSPPPPSTCVAGSHIGHKWSI